MISIMMAGGVYCSLSPRDPQQRLDTLVQQCQSRLVLAHYQTEITFQNGVTLINIDSVLTNNNIQRDVDFDRLSSVVVTSDDIAYVIFTSGSTGIPKAVG